MSDRKFLGGCIVVASFVLSASILWHGQNTAQLGRFQFQANDGGVFFYVIDTITGEIYAKQNAKRQEEF